MSPADYLLAAATAALAGQGTYLRENHADANLDSFDAALPLIVLGDYSSQQRGPESRVSSALLTLYFADKRPGDGDSPEAHFAAVARMEALQRRLLAALDAYPKVQLDSIRATPMASLYAAELDGIGVQLTVTVPAVALC